MRTADDLLVVPNVEMIRGLNLPGTTRATSACRGTPLLYFTLLYFTLLLYPGISSAAPQHDEEESCLMKFVLPWNLGF